MTKKTPLLIIVSVVVIALAAGMFTINALSDGGAKAVATEITVDTKAKTGTVMGAADPISATKTFLDAIYRQDENALYEIVYRGAPRDFRQYLNLELADRGLEPNNPKYVTYQLERPGSKIVEVVCPENGDVFFRILTAEKDGQWYVYNVLNEY